MPFPTRSAISVLEPFYGLGLEDIRLVTTQKQAATALSELLAEPYLGFDTESKPTFRAGQRSDGPHVLQFATPRRAYLFQTHEPFCTSTVATILTTEHTAKVGFGLNDDIERIRIKFGIHPQSVIDLDHTFKSLGHTNSVGTKTAIAHLFGKRLIKSRKVTTSNWSSRALSDKQVLYAANDAFGALAVFMALKEKGVRIVEANGPKESTGKKRRALRGRSGTTYNQRSCNNLSRREAQQ